MTAKMQLPPGFRFHPTDEELVTHYLCRKCASETISVPIIAEINLYKFDPWQLPGMALYGEKEWYFFSPRDRKYPNGSRPNRAAGSGYWKATGADKAIGKAIKKALVFYAGKAPKGEKTNWIMHEYRLADVDRSARNKNSLRLDDWVLCRIYNKKGTIVRKPTMCSESYEQKPDLHVPPPSFNEYAYFATSDSVPRFHTDSSGSAEQVVSPDFTCEREVQSQPKLIMDWENVIDNPYNYVDATMDNAYRSQFQNTNQLSPLQDIFMCLQTPF